MWGRDLLGKLLITSFSLISEMNTIIIGTAGLSQQSVDFLIDFYKKYFIDERNKCLIVTI
jgi:hypothetical protein